MTHIRYILAVVFLLCIAFRVTAQFYVSGQDAASTKWMQIKTDQFKLVFPDYAEKQAQLLAQQLNQAIPHLSDDIQHKNKRINVVMHMDAATSNGMVVWAPKRMEVFNTPPQDIESHNWWGQLALHEYRHVLQVDKLNQGFTKALGYLFGQQATGAILGLYVPLWYLEGDAVLVETRFSAAGRGRNPDFNQGLLAQLERSGKYSYEKAYFGSYKDFVPNHYVLGYHMVAKANQIYGENFWNEHIDFVAKYPFAFPAWHWSLKKQTGMRQTAFYSMLMDSLTNDWKNARGHADFAEVQALFTPDSNKYVDYRFPQQMNDGQIICLRRGVNERAHFIQIDSLGNEERIFTPGTSSFHNLNAKAGKLTWAEKAYHPRWDHVQYNNIMILDIKTRKARQLSHKQRYFAPQINAEGTRIVCSEVTKENQYSIVILDAKDGKVLYRFPSETFVMMPVWSVDEKHILALQLQHSKGKQIVQIDIETGRYEILSPPVFDHIRSVFQNTEGTFLIAGFNGVMNVYKLSDDGKGVAAITHVPYGISDMSTAKSGKLLFSSYTAMGYRLCQQDVSNIASSYFAPDQLSVHFVSYSDSLRHDSTFNLQSIASDTLSAFKVSRYKSLDKFFNPHSWGPVSIDGANGEARPGFRVSSQNLLNNSLLSLGVDYEWGFTDKRYFMEYSYLGWFPEISISAERRDARGLLIAQDFSISYFDFYRDELKLSLSVPLKLNKGKYLNYIRPTVDYRYMQSEAAPSTPVEFVESNDQVLSGRLYAYHLLRKSSRTIGFRRGIILDVNYLQSIDTPTSKHFAAEASVFAPGFMRFHSMELYGGLQKRVDRGLLFSNSVVFPRGFEEVYPENLWAFQYDYKLPLLCPDLKLGSVLYLKRISSTLFYDYAKAEGIGEERINNTYSSTGVEITFEGHLLRFIAPIAFGVRRSLADGNHVTEFLLSVNYNF